MWKGMFQGPESTIIARRAMRAFRQQAYARQQLAAEDYARTYESSIKSLNNDASKDDLKKLIVLLQTNSTDYNPI